MRVQFDEKDNTKIEELDFSNENNPNIIRRVKITPNNDDSQAYIHTYIQDENRFTCKYTPAETNPEYIKGIVGLSCLKKITSLLPKIEMPMSKTDFADYPNVRAEAADLFGYDYHDEREVFVFGKHIFFRRYNDSWNELTVYGKRTSSKNITWEGPHSLHTDFLERLYDLLKLKGENITETDVESILVPYIRGDTRDMSDQVLIGKCNTNDLGKNDFTDDEIEVTIIGGDNKSDSKAKTKSVRVTQKEKFNSDDESTIVDTVDLSKIDLDQI